MNTNLNSLLADIQALQLQVSDLDGTVAEVSARASTRRYCGVSTFDVAVTTGYAGVSSQCRTASGCSAAATICSGSELVQSAATNVEPPEGWFAGGTYSEFGNAGISSDCIGFRSDNPARRGAFWNQYPGFDTCDAHHRVLCCE